MMMLGCDIAIYMYLVFISVSGTELLKTPWTSVLRFESRECVFCYVNKVSLVAREPTLKARGLEFSALAVTSGRERG